MKGTTPQLTRRCFLVSGAAAASVSAAVSPLAIAAVTGAAAPSGSPKTSEARKVLHIIGHSHIDAAWLWPWRDAEDETLNTFRSALNRLEETPDFRFSHSSSAHYRWVYRADPAMYAEVKRRIEEGRWEVLGGWRE